MEPTKSTESATTKVRFKRTGRIGFDLLTLKVGETVFANIKKFDTYQAKDGSEIDYFDFVNMDTGVEQRIWVDGGLKGALSSLGEPRAAVGRKLEILRNPKVAAMVEIDNKMVEKEVNSYSIWEIQD